MSVDPTATAERAEAERRAMSAKMAESHAVAVTLVRAAEAAMPPGTHPFVPVMAGAMVFATFVASAGLPRDVAHAALEDALVLCERSAADVRERSARERAAKGSGG